MLEDETGDADARGRGAVPLDGPPAKGVRWVPLGKLDAVGEVDGVDTAADEEVGRRGAGGERGLDVLVVAALELPPSSAASLGRKLDLGWGLGAICGTTSTGALPVKICLKIQHDLE